MATPLDFARALLNRFNFPQTENRIVSIVAFEAQEGGHYYNGARFNPLNTTLGMPGATNAVGAVKAYTSWKQGIEATARTMAQSNMRAMMDALRRDARPHDFLVAVTSTPWCPQPKEGEPDNGCRSYASRDPYALFKQYANTPDPVGGALDTSSTAGIMGWVKDHPFITVGAILVASGGALYYFRPDLFKRVPVVGQLAQENPVQPRKRSAPKQIGSGGSKVQTLLFPRTSFTPDSAAKWAKSHGFKSSKVDVTDQYVRIRQLPPGGRMRTIQFKGTPVKAVVRFG
jgi:hypothetical protein